MKIENLSWIRNLSLTEIPEFGSRLYESFKSIATGTENTELQGNLNPQGQPIPPPPIQNLSVTGQNGQFNIAIQHDSPDVRRGVRYYVEHADNPNFTDPHAIFLGDARNHTLFLGNVDRYWRASAAYGASAPSSWSYHGGTIPAAVNGGGSIGGPAFQPSQGSGTGAPGQGLSGPGPVLQRNKSNSFDWNLQHSALGGGFTPEGTPAGNDANGSAAGGGGGGGVTISEPIIASCEWLTTVAGTNTVTAKTAVPYSALAAGFLVRFVPANTNSGAVTLNVNAIGAKAVTKNGTTALVGGELVAGKECLLGYDGTRWQIIGIIGPASATVLASNANGVPTAAPLTKGNVWAGDASNLPAALAPGTDGQVLTANSGATKGLEYEDPISLTTTGSSGAATLTPGNPYVLNIPNYSGSSGTTGTWTPGIQFNGGTTGITYGLQVGNYFSIGNMVFAYFDITLSSKGSSTGFAEVTGLPSAVSATFIVTGSLTFYQNMSGIQATPSALPSVGTDRAVLLDFTATDGVTLDDTNFTNTSRIVGMVIYYS